jgi:hypothetical protein
MAKLLRIVLLALISPYVILIWFGLVNDYLPPPLRSVFESGFYHAVVAVFNLRKVKVSEVESWALIGPSKTRLPPALCSALFMRGNIAADAVGDPTWGEWNEADRTLTLPLSKRGVWTWNDNYEGAKIFYGAWILDMKYVFQFNQDLTYAVIKAPVLGGLGDFVELSSDKGSIFQMEADFGFMSRLKWRLGFGFDGRHWIRKSFYSNGSPAFPDYKPTSIMSCAGGVDHSNLRESLAAISDHPTFNPKAELVGAATSMQLVRGR